MLYYPYMQIKGEIVRITYHNPENGYTIATLSHGKEHTTIVGKFFAVSVGQEVSLSGEFVTNKTYGQQFAFSTFETISPTSVSGIKKFLGSGLIKGVGLITAGHITKHFKTDTLEIIEHQPERLAEIKGISLKKALAINESYMQYKHVQNVVVFLTEYGISVNLALKIFEIFKNQTLEKIQENPYCLIEAVNGIGFMTADKIAEKFGIENSSPFRLRAGLVHILKVASERNGHTFLPKKSLFLETSKLLNIDPASIQDTLEKLINNLTIEGVVCKSKIDGEEIVALEKFFRFEQKLAQKITLLSHFSSTVSTNLENAISHFEKIHHINFHSEQKKRHN